MDDMLKLSVFEQLQKVDEKAEFRKSQITKFFSVEKDPIQWQIETNIVECLKDLFNFSKLIQGLHSVVIEIQDLSEAKEKTSLQPTRLVEMFISEKRFLKNQLLTIESIITSPEQREYVNQVESFLQEMESSSALAWILEYVQTAGRITLLFKETYILLKKFQKQIDCQMEKLTHWQTESDDQSVQQYNSKHSMLSNFRKSYHYKTQPTIYRCGGSNLESDTSHRQDKINAQSYQQKAIVDQHRYYRDQYSIEEIEKSHTIEVLNYTDAEIKLVKKKGKKNNDAPIKSQEDCLSCNLF